MSYKIKLDFFEGPLDLLLYLIKKSEVNIYDIPIAKVTEQYLQYIELMKLLDLDIIGDFLVMAATLIQIKSRMLLPQEQEQEEEEEDPRAELVKRLLEYQKYKEVATQLREKETAQKELFIRPRDESDKKEYQEKEVYFEASLFDLISAFSNALKDVPKEAFYQIVKDEYTVDEKIHDLLHMLLLKPEVDIVDLFRKSKSKFEIIAYFLGILELIRLKEIIVVQKQLFGDIKIVRNLSNISIHGRKTPETHS
ncbi:segregation and condensation protein A [Candidatus Omnitrophota bacterium]